MTSQEIKQQALQNISEKKEVALPNKSPEVAPVQQEEKLVNLSTPEIQAIPQEEIDNQIQAQEVKEQPINFDAKSQALEQLATAKEEQQQQTQPVEELPADSSPFSDIMPVIKTKFVQKEIDDWSQQIPNQNNEQTQAVQAPTGITYQDVPAQSISGLRNGTNFGYSRTDPLTGECFAKGTMVLMSDKTYKPIEEVAVGDKVIGKDKIINEVTHIFIRRKKTILLRTNISDTIVTKDHPYYTNGVFVEAQLLENNVDTPLTSYRTEEKTNLTEQEQIFYGAWLADGDIYEDKYKSKIARLTVNDEKLEKLKNTGIYFSHCLHSNHKAHCICLPKTKNPNLYKVIVKSGKNKNMIVKSKIIAETLFDFDGYKNEMYSANLNLLLQVQSVLGGKITLKEKSGLKLVCGKICKIKDQYRLRLIEGKRKIAYKKVLNNVKKVYNLEASGNNTFFANNTLVHNCAREAQRWTTLSNGKNWTIGSTIQEKKAQLAEHVKNNNAFYQGNGAPTVGNSVIFNGGKYGHVAVIAEIKDGKARLEEANLNNDHRFTNTRWVSLADPSILGFLKTVKRGS